MSLVAAGFNADLSLGVVSVVAYDCEFYGASGVQLELTSESSDGGAMQPHYQNNGQLDPTATSTDTSGVALFVDVPAGRATVTATPKGLASPSSVVTLNVRAGAITGVFAPPTPQ